MRASEQESEALRRSTAEETAARILAEIDSKPCPTLTASDNPLTGSVAMGADVADDRRSSDSFDGERGAARGSSGVVDEICRRFEGTRRDAQAAGACAAKAEAELDRVRSEAEATLRQQREVAAALAADAQRAARRAAAAAAERVAAGEGALRTARAEVSRLRGELQRAREMEAEAASRAVAAEERKAELNRKIARLEGDLREAVAEHRRSRQVAGLEIEQLRAALERRDEAAECAAAVVNENGLSRRGEPAAAAVAAEMEVAAEQRLLVETSRHELRAAEQAVAEATEEVESLRGQLARTMETVATSETRRQAAETKIYELEEELQEAAREHLLFREAVEERLRVLKASFEEENAQNGAQVC